MHVANTRELGGGKFVISADFIETLHVMFGDSVLEEHERWDRANSELVHEERRFLDVELHELSAEAPPRHFREMHIHDLAPLELLVVEMTDDQIRTSYLFEELRFDNLLVLAVALGLHLVTRRKLLLHLGYPGRAQGRKPGVLVRIVRSVALGVFLLGGSLPSRIDRR